MSEIIPTVDWQALDTASFKGLIMIIGGPDSGKSALARYLYERLHAEGRPVAFLDGDPGQTFLGPPGTITLATGALQAPERIWRRFIGAVSPRGHMLPLLVGAARLVRLAWELDVKVIIYDTCGLVDPTRGGLMLKWFKVELLQPTHLIALQAASELELILNALRGKTAVTLLKPSPFVRSRDTIVRQSHRARQFAQHFTAAHPLELDWSGLGVFPRPDFVYQQVVSLEDQEGFSLALGIVLSAAYETRRLRVLTPLPSTQGLTGLRLGDFTINPSTFQEAVLPK